MDAKKKTIRNWLAVIVTVVFFAFQMYLALVKQLNPMLQSPLHLILALTLVFLYNPADKAYRKKVTKAAEAEGKPVDQKKLNAHAWMNWFDILLFICLAYMLWYVVGQNARLLDFVSVQPVYGIDYIFMVMTIVLLLIAVYRTLGIVLTIFIAVFILYAFTSPYLPGILFTKGKTFAKFIKQFCVGMTMGESGVFGTPLYTSANTLFYFIVFGAFFSSMGGGQLLIDIGMKFSNKSSGGPAKAAVISSGLMGMISGSAVANVATTGVTTIPMMKKTGYPPEFAGAVEAAASTGGQIMPPIMGAAAFLMAEYIGIPYAKVAVKAILPAILYFTGIFIAVHLEAKKLGLKGVPREELPAWRLLVRDCYLIIPLILLVWLVSSGSKTMSHSAAYSILAAIAVGFVNFFLQGKRGEGDTQPMTTGKALGNAGKRSFFSAVESLEAGSRGAITVAVACSMAGIIAGCITVTGLASILINAIVQLAGNATIVGLVLTMLCCIVLGMGVPTTANYCIMASTCAPILIQLGFPLVAAHFFVFYFGIVADITPPVALAAYAGSAIAKSDPMKTGINATKLAIAAFIVPYIFAYSPALLFENISGWWEVAQICVSALLGIFAIAASLNGFLYKKIHPVLRIVLAVGGLGMMIPGTLTDVVGLVVVAAVIAYQKISAKKHGGPVMTV